MIRLPKGYIDRTLKKYYSAHETTIHIRRFKDGNNVSQNIYGERLGKRYGQPIACLCYLETDPTDLRLEELGWTKEMAEIILKIPFTILENSNLISQDGSLDFSTDDVIELPFMKDKRYNISNILLQEPYINGKPLNVYVGGRHFVNGK